MKGLKIWGWILFTISMALYFYGFISGDFTGHGIYKMNNMALLLVILSTVSFLLAITVWAVVRALNEKQNKK